VGGVSERPETGPDLPASGPESDTLDPGQPAPVGQHTDAKNTLQRPARGPQQHLVAEAPDGLPTELIELWATLDAEQRQALLAGLRRLAGK